MIERKYTIDDAALRTEFPTFPGLASERMNYLLALAGCPLRVGTDETVASTMVRVMDWLMVAFPSELKRFEGTGTFTEALRLLDTHGSGVIGIRRKAWRAGRTIARDKAMAALPAERAAMLRLPFLEVNQAKWLVEEITERINQRTEHDLEGWLEAGLTTMDFELPDIGVISAQKFLAMPADKQAMLKALATPVPRLMTSAIMSDSR